MAIATIASDGDDIVSSSYLHGGVSVARTPSRLNVLTLAPPDLQPIQGYDWPDPPLVLPGPDDPFIHAVFLKESGIGVEFV